MQRPLRSVLLLLLFLLPALSAQAATPATPATDPELAAQIDTLLAKTYPANEPGAAVLVEKGGQVLLRKGYGMANLELGVPIAPEMVFRLGSITYSPTLVLEGVKSLSYAANMLASRLARERGYDEALLLDASGFVSEGAGENVFMVKRGVVGLITDGVVRDIAGVLATRLPVWCSGAAAASRIFRACATRSSAARSTPPA